MTEKEEERCLKWFENQLDSNWMQLNEEQTEIYRATTVLLSEFHRLKETIADSDIVKCRQCQTERTGEGYGDVPPKIGYDDRCDECPIAKRLRDGLF